MHFRGVGSGEQKEPPPETAKIAVKMVLFPNEVLLKNSPKIFKNVKSSLPKRAKLC